MNSRETNSIGMFAGTGNSSKPLTTKTNTFAAIDVLAQEISYYNRYKELIQKKFEQKHLLRYKCEFNFLKKLITTKENELKALQLLNKPIIVETFKRDPKIFYSKSYLARMATAAAHCQERSDRLSEYVSDDMRTVWQKRSSSGRHQSPSPTGKTKLKFFIVKNIEQNSCILNRKYELEAISKLRRRRRLLVVV